MLGNGRSVGPGQTVRGPSGCFPQRSRPRTSHAQPQDSQPHYSQSRHAQSHSQPRYSQPQHSLQQYTNANTIPATYNAYARRPNGSYLNQNQQTSNYAQPSTYLQQKNNNTQKPRTKPGDLSINAPSPTAKYQDNTSYNRLNNGNVPRTKLSDLAKEYPHYYLQNPPADSSPYLYHHPAAYHKPQPKTQGSVCNNNVKMSYAPVYAPYNSNNGFSSSVQPAGAQRSLCALVNASIAEGNVYTNKQPGNNYTSIYGAIPSATQKKASNIPLNPPRAPTHDYKRENCIPAARAVPASNGSRQNTTANVPVSSQVTASSFNYKDYVRPVGAAQKSLRAFLDQQNIQPPKNGVHVVHQQPKKQPTAPEAHETNDMSPQKNITPGNIEQKTSKAPYVPVYTKVSDPSSLPPPKFICGQQEANKLASVFKAGKQEPPPCQPMASNPHTRTSPAAKSSPAQEQKDEKQEHTLATPQTEADPSKSSYLTAPPRANVMPPPGYVHPLKQTETLLRQQFYLNRTSPSPKLVPTSGNSSDTIKAPINSPTQKDDKKRYSPANQSPEVAPNEPDFMQFPDGKDLPAPKFFIELQRKEEEAKFRAASFMNSTPIRRHCRCRGLFRSCSAQGIGGWAGPATIKLG